VSVLQHIGDDAQAVAEFARVTAAGGRIVAVEPDNSARYLYSSVASGQEAMGHAAPFFSALLAARGETIDATAGPRLPTLFVEHGIEPLSVRLFPVATTILGQPSAEVWRNRRDRIESAMASVDDRAVASSGRRYLDALARYERDASDAGSSFVEIQNTMLFAAVGQKSS
jgi:hypothetical protein